MSDKAKTVYSCNFSFLSLLTIAFIVLKLTGTISWSWWFVLMPLYLPTAILVVLFLAIFIAYLICDSKR